MKRIITLLFILLMLPVAFALQEGQVFTQQQLNNFPIDTYTTTSSLVTLLQCQRVGNGTNTLVHHKWYYIKPFSCLQLDRLTRDTYVVHRKIFYPRFSLRSYDNCITNLSTDITIRNRVLLCNEYFGENLRDMGRNKISHVKKEVERYQDEPDSTRDFGGDFGGDYFT